MKTRGLPNAYEGGIHAPKESLDVEHDDAGRLLNVEGLEIFYREAGPRKDRSDA